MHAKNFFTEEERERIRQAVAAAERRTSGEIVPMIVGASNHYAEVEITALIAGLVIATAAAFLFADPWAPARSLLIWPLVGSGLGFALARIPALKRKLIPERHIAEAVHIRSLAAFAAHGLHYTAGYTGILILASLFERRVVVLADRGIHEKVSPGTWDEVARALTNGIKSGNGSAAFCEAVKRCGDILATHFPRQAGDRDQLDDKLVVED